SQNLWSHRVSDLLCMTQCPGNALKFQPWMYRKWRLNGGEKKLIISPMKSPERSSLRPVKNISITSCPMAARCAMVLALGGMGFRGKDVLPSLIRGNGRAGLRQIQWLHVSRNWSPIPSQMAGWTRARPILWAHAHSISTRMGVTLFIGYTAPTSHGQLAAQFLQAASA